MSDEIALKILINSQKEMRQDLKSLKRSIDYSHIRFDKRLGEVEDWKAGHIGFKKGFDSSNAKHISRVTFITSIICAMLAVCGFLWAIKPQSTHAVITDTVKEQLK